MNLYLDFFTMDSKSWFFQEKLSENICEHYRTIGVARKLSMAIISPFLFPTLYLSVSFPSDFPNLLPPTRSSVLNYLLTPANLLAAELWSALNELLREHHKLEYSVLSRALDVGQCSFWITIKLFKQRDTKNVFIVRFYGRIFCNVLTRNMSILIIRFKL